MTEDSSMDIYNNPDLIKLKNELLNLEIQFSILSEEKINIEKVLHEFTVRHNHELGDVLLKILEIRKNKAKNTPKAESAEKEYSKFKNEKFKSDEIQIDILSGEELTELKAKYRKASKLCHPDMVQESQKDMANKIFTDLNKAYEDNNLKKLTEILHMLEKGDFFSKRSDIINENEALIAEIARIKSFIEDLISELSSLKQSKIYLTIKTITDWDEYFNENRIKLEEQLKAFSYE